MDNEITIVSCERHDGEGEAYDVIFDSGESLSVSYEEAVELGLYRVGEPCACFSEICIKLLSKRILSEIAAYVLFTSRTCAQIEQRITSVHDSITGGNTALDAYVPEAAARALDKLKELGYVDDELFARKYVMSALKGKPVSKAELMNKLVYVKGISKETAEYAINAVYSENDAASDEKAAYMLVKQKTKGNIPVENKDIVKLYRYMAGKGFSAHDTENAIRLINEEKEENIE